MNADFSQDTEEKILEELKSVNQTLEVIHNVLLEILNAIKSN